MAFNHYKLTGLTMNELLEIAESSASEVSEPFKKKVCELFNLLIKGIKAKLVYPASSRLPQQFLEEIYAALRNLLEEEGSITFRVEADRILYEDIVVYRSQSKSENFAHPFFRDGILSFEFAKEISIQELSSFNDLISRMMRSAYVDDDLATLLWEASFNHISYKLMDDVLNIETFEYGLDSLKSNSGGQGRPDIQKLYNEEINLELSVEDFEITPEARGKRKQSAPYASVPDVVGDFMRKLMVFDDAEKAALEELMKADETFDANSYIIDLLFEILGMETDNAGYHEALELIGKVRDDFIRAGDFISASLILGRVKELEQAFKNLKDLKLDKIQGFIESFAAPEKIKVIIGTLNRQTDFDQSHVIEYIKMLHWKAIPSLIDGLGDVMHHSGRRLICKALVSLGSNRIELLAKGIEDHRWFVVRNIVMVLGQINNPRALSYFRKTIRHPELRVRKETVISAARIGSEEASDFLIMALSDDDEKLQIMALRELVNQRITKAYAPIERIVIDKKFKDRSADQMKEFLEAMAKLGGSRALEYMKKTATQVSLLSSEKQQRLRNYAIRALGFIETHEVEEILEKLAKSRNAALADTARRSLNKRIKAE